MDIYLPTDSLPQICRSRMVFLRGISLFSPPSLHHTHPFYLRNLAFTVLFMVDYWFPSLLLLLGNPSTPLFLRGVSLKSYFIKLKMERNVASANYTVLRLPKAFLIFTCFMLSATFTFTLFGYLGLKCPLSDITKRVRNF